MGAVRILLLLSLVACTACAGMSNRSERELRLRGQLEKLPLADKNVSLVADVRPDDDRRFEVHSVHVVGRHILVEDTRGRLYAFDRQSLLPAWHYYGMKRPMRFRPYAGAAHYWTVSGDEIHQINAAIGVGELAVQLPFTPSSGAAGTVGVGFVGSWASPSGNKTMYSINAATGRPGWGYRSPGHVTGAPVVTAGARRLIVFPSHDGRVTAIEVAPADGAAPPAAWMFGSSTGGRMSADLVLAKGGKLVLAACEDGSLYALDVITGKRVWEYPSGKPLKRAPVATSDAVYFRNGYGFHCLTLDGVLRWKNDDAKRFICKRAGQVWADNGSGKVVIIDDATGETLSKHRMGSGWFLPTNPVDGIFIAISRDGMAYAFTERLKLQ